MKRKMTSCILVCSMIISMSTDAVALAAEEVSIQSGYVNTASVEPASSEEIAAAAKYAIMDPEFATKVGLDAMSLRRSFTEDLEQLLYNCSVVNWINTIDDRLYINYTTNDAKEVIVGYNDEGLIEQCVYDQITDCAISICAEEQLKYNGARYGLTYNMAESTSDLIDWYIETDNVDGLKQVDGINVIEDEDGNISIEEEMPPSFAEAIGANQVSTFAAAPTTECALMTS